MCRCRSCNRILSSRETTRKFDNWEEIKNPEYRYIGLCNSCFHDTPILLAEINPTLSDSDGEAYHDDGEDVQVETYYISDESLDEELDSRS